MLLKIEEIEPELNTKERNEADEKNTAQIIFTIITAPKFK